MVETIFYEERVMEHLGKIMNVKLFLTTRFKSFYEYVVSM